ncbi:hypothetical protein psyc5s11_32760 [Clostridium gelidum]|uniref:Uncharacterized protein n=1 Tax=Clostridium gelidum TaxID=704125 RepID=A0ABM7T5G6_9CLOT|nr:hypothetical protein psyc5s11_32760 [Clostridium gelidum]
MLSGGRWCEGFGEIFYEGTLSSTVVNNGANRELQDIQYMKLKSWKC